MEKETRFALLGEVADILLKGDCASEVVGDALDCINGTLLEDSDLSEYNKKDKQIEEQFSVSIKTAFNPFKRK